MNQIIAKELEVMKNNPTIKNFVEGEAYSKMADDINSKPGRCCTVEAAKILVHTKKNSNLLSRWNEYVAAGYVGVMMAKYQH